MGPVSVKSRSIQSVIAQLHDIGVEHGDVLLVHASFRAVRPIVGGPAGLIEALSEAIGPQGTLVMPSWTGDDDRPFDPKADPANPDLGVVPDIFWRLPGVLRSDHPFAYAARGPIAHRILADGLPLPPMCPESPAGRVLECDGRILLLGVDHDANSSLHLCELLADVPYRTPKHITVLRDGRPQRIDYAENDHCCQRFNEAGDWLKERGLQRAGPVGDAPSKLMRSRDLVDIVVPRLQREPFAFLHPRGSGCEECDKTWQSVPN